MNKKKYIKLTAVLLIITLLLSSCSAQPPASTSSTLSSSEPVSSVQVPSSTPSSEPSSTPSSAPSSEPSSVPSSEPSSAPVVSSEPEKPKLDLSGQHYEQARTAARLGGNSITFTTECSDSVERMHVISCTQPDANGKVTAVISLGSKTDGVPDGYLAEFKNGLALSPNVKAKVSISGTNLNYFLPQTTDNAFYMQNDISGAPSKWGTPFIGFNSRIEMFNNSSNIMLYGYSNHNDGSLFQAIHEYKSLDFYKSHPTIEFDTAYEKGTWAVIGLAIVPTPLDEFKYWQYSDFKSESEFNSYIDNVKKRSYFLTTTDVKYGDSLLTMQTSDKDPDRISGAHVNLILVARKLRFDESATVDVSGATINANQKTPHT